MALSDNVPIYCRASRKTRLCMRRRRTSYGNVYIYRPRADFLNRISKEMGIPPGTARERIAKERRYLLDNPWVPFDLQVGD